MTAACKSLPHHEAAPAIATHADRVTGRGTFRSLANQARQPDLPIGPLDCLGQRSRRNGDRAPVSCARGRRTTTRRSFRSRAIRPPASRVTPGIRPPACPRAVWYRGPRQPRSARSRRAHRRFPAAPRRALPPTPPRHPRRRRQRAARSQKRWPRFPHPRGCVRSSCASSRVIVTFFDAAPGSIPIAAGPPGSGVRTKAAGSQAKKAALKVLETR
jgi:hypothetical protein